MITEERTLQTRDKHVGKVLEALVGHLSDIFCSKDDLAAIYQVFGAQIEMVAGYNHCQETFDSTYDLDEGLVSLIVQSKEAIIENDLHSNKMTKYLNTGAYAERGIRSAMLIPIIHDEELVGIFEMASAKHDYTPKYLEKAKSYMTLAALAFNGIRTERFTREMISIMSHELRTPSSVGIGYTDLIRTHLNQVLAGQEPNKQLITQCLDGIKQSYRTMLPLIGNIDTIKEIFNGTLSLHPEVIHLDKVVAEEVEKNKLVNNGVDYIVRLDAAPRFYGDRRLLAQAFNKILENAQKYARSTIRITTSGGDREAYLSITNDGMPIGEKECSTVFKYGIGNNTGIGGYLAWLITKAHKGTLQPVRLEDGTSFDFIFPTH